MKRILVTGANGQLGMELQTLARSRPDLLFQFTDLPTLDITNSNAVNEFFDNAAFDFCINCAAYTAVDKAETERDAAFAINSAGAQHLAEACRKAGVALIHISTDFVFDGRKSSPYTEEDHVSPVGVYGTSKISGERLVLNGNSQSLVIRTSWLYSPFGQNFLKTMLRLSKEKSEIKVVSDQVGTPTYALDLANALLQIVSAGAAFKPGVYHFSNEGVCSWYDFAVEILRAANSTCKVIPIETAAYPTAARRPAFSVLNKQKIKSQFGISIPHWRESMLHCLERLSK